MKAQASSHLPRLGLGTWQLGGDVCRRVVAAALEIGYRHVDTAQGYDNEREVGAAIRASALPREELFVTTKVWPDHLQDEGAAAVARSLERLGLEQLDLLLLHWPSPQRPLAGSLQPLLQVLQQGMTRHVGVSNFPGAMLAAACAEAPIVCNQIELHPYLQQPRLRAEMERLQVQAVAYSPLACGAVTADPQLAALGAAAGRSAAQVALRWLLQQGIAAVPKATSPAHLRTNLAALDFELPEAAMTAIARMDRGRRLIDPPFAPAWDD